MDNRRISLLEPRSRSQSLSLIETDFEIDRDTLHSHDSLLNTALFQGFESLSSSPPPLLQPTPIRIYPGQIIPLYHTNLPHDVLPGSERIYNSRHDPTIQSYAPIEGPDDDEVLYHQFLQPMAYLTQSFPFPTSNTRSSAFQTSYEEFSWQYNDEQGQQVQGLQTSSFSASATEYYSLETPYQNAGRQYDIHQQNDWLQLEQEWQQTLTGLHLPSSVPAPKVLNSKTSRKNRNPRPKPTSLRRLAPAPPRFVPENPFSFEPPHIRGYRVESPHLAAENYLFVEPPQIQNHGLESLHFAAGKPPSIWSPQIRKHSLESTYLRRLAPAPPRLVPENPFSFEPPTQKRPRLE